MIGAALGLFVGLVGIFIVLIGVAGVELGLLQLFRLENSSKSTQGNLILAACGLWIIVNIFWLRKPALLSLDFF
jgi:hypothetical protein